MTPDAARPLAGGTRIGPYEIVDWIGAGGMGEVYRARDSRLGRDVALKIIPAALAAEPDRVRRFEQEARAAGQLNHPNILAVHDVGVHAGTPYIVSELLEGEHCAAACPAARWRRGRPPTMRGRSPTAWPPPTPGTSSIAI
jgi:serine/threonine protein kinase